MHLNEFYKLFTDMEKELLKPEAVTHYQVTIELHNPEIAGGVIRWTLKDAFPVKWVAPSLKADDTSIAMESLEFAHHGIKVDVTPPSERGD
jgi:phage tail-like protein